MASRNVGLEQCESLFSIVLQFTLQTRTEGIKGQNAKTAQDVMNHSVFNSIPLTHGCSSLLKPGFHKANPDHDNDQF